MKSKIKACFQGINFKLLLALIITGFVPAIYITLRIHWLGNFPGDFGFEVAGQLTAINLLYEVVNEAFILPLFYFLSKSLKDKEGFTNKIRSGLLISGFIYLFFALLIIGLAEPILYWLKASDTIIQHASKYIRLEAIAYIFNVLVQFCLVCFISLEKSKWMYILTGFRLVLILIFDYFFVSHFSFSLQLGVNGIAISNLISNFLSFILALIILIKMGYRVVSFKIMDFSWFSSFYKINLISAIEALVRAIFYLILVFKLVNMIGLQGPYWVAHTFIMTWLFVPINAMCSLIEEEVSKDKNHIKNNTIGYLLITFLVVIIWLALIPSFPLFIKGAYAADDYHIVVHVILVLIGFYILQAFEKIFDAIFNGLGKNNYMLIELVISTLIYCTTFLILYECHVIAITLTNIDLVFGGAIAFNALVSFATFIYWSKKEHIKFI